MKRVDLTQCTVDEWKSVVEHIIKVATEDAWHVNCILRFKGRTGKELVRLVATSHRKGHPRKLRAIYEATVWTIVLAIEQRQRESL